MNIIVIIGHTGAGKSTLCKKLASRYKAKLVSFADEGKTFSIENGYSRIRDCYSGLGEEAFVSLFSEFFSNNIEKAINKSNFVIIDGLYEQNIALKLKNSYGAKFILIDVPINVCFSRIASRNNLTFAEVESEYAIKESVKDSLGNTYVLNMADLTVDGRMTIEEVYSYITNRIDEYLF